MLSLFCVKQHCTMTVSEPRREGQRNKSLFGSSTLIYFSFLETVVSAEKPQPSEVSTDTPTLLPSRGEEGGKAGRGGGGGLGIFKE